MKRLIPVLVLTWIIPLLINAQDLRQITAQSFKSSYDVFSSGENTKWIAAEDGIVYKIIDGGYNWETIQTPSALNLSSIYFVDDTTGFVGGADTVIYKTADGGTTWQMIDLPTGSFPVVSICFSDSAAGWVLTNKLKKSQILYTSDGGAAWTVALNLTSATLQDISFFSPGRGIAVGGGVGALDLYYTKDGSSWTKAPVPAIEGNYNRLDARSVFMVNDSVAYTCGWGSRAVGLEPSIFLKTTNGGETWTWLPQTAGSEVYVNMNSLWFKDELNGIAVGGASYEGSVAVKTTDGGLNWTQISIPFGSTLNGISGDNDELIAAGNNGLIAVSENFGESWELVTKIPSSSLYAITFPDKNIGFAAGSDGVFLKTEDKGEVWINQYVSQNNVCPAIKDIHFLNEDIGYLARSNKLVSKTMDGGETWSVVMKDTFSVFFSNESVHFINQDTGFVVGSAQVPGESGSKDVIYKTTDGGQTWMETLNQFGVKLFNVNFYDAENGIVSGADTTIAYTTDGGTSWKKSSTTGVKTAKPAIKGIAYISKSKVFAVGDKVILNSTDGGVNWTDITFDEIITKKINLTGIAFKDTVKGYMVGKNYFYETTDGGNSWTNISNENVIPATGFLYGVTLCQRGYPWVSGGNSSIFTTAIVDTTTEDTTTTSVNGLNSPGTYTIYQNYPNPFNPETFISYSLPKSCHVEVKVFDMLGKEISTLVNEVKQSGTHMVRFNGAHLTSGNYFYTVNIDGKTTTRKMTFLK